MSHPFKVDWFSEHISAWESVLLDPKWRNKAMYKKNGLHALLVGAYEGRVLHWLMENVLTSDKDTASVLDPMEYKACVSERGRGVWNPLDRVRDTLVGVLRAHQPRASMFTPDTRLSDLAVDGAAYDVVYVDAHDSVHALECSVHAMRLLRPGGILVLQNYTHNQEHDTNCPRVGIDAFLATYVRYITVTRNGFHTFVQKRTQALPRRNCHSEYYPLPKTDEPVCDQQSTQTRANAPTRANAQMSANAPTRANTQMSARAPAAHTTRTFRATRNKTATATSGGPV